MLGAVEAKATGNNALAGATAGAVGEGTAMLLTQDKSVKDLTESEKQNVVALSQLASGIAGGIVGDSTSNAVAGAEIGKRSVENNYLYVEEAKEKAILERKIQLGKATEAEINRRNQLDLIDQVRDKDIVNACNLVSSEACQNLAQQAEYAQYGYEKYISYNLQLKEIYPKDYQNVTNILKGKDKDSVEFEKTAIAISQDRKISLSEAKTFLGNVMLYKEFAELAGMGRGATAAKYGIKPMKVVTPPVGYEKVTFNGIELHPDLPPPKAGYNFEPKIAKGNSIYQQWKDINGYRGKIVLANNIASTGRTVVKWGNSTGTNGSDIISVNPRTGEVELWDNKYRSGSTAGKISPTFDKPNTRGNAIQEAIEALEQAKNIPPEIRNTAIQNLNRGNFITYTVGSGKVKNSVIQKFCNYQKCAN